MSVAFNSFRKSCKSVNFISSGISLILREYSERYDTSCIYAFTEFGKRPFSNFKNISKSCMVLFHTSTISFSISFKVLVFFLWFFYRRNIDFCHSPGYYCSPFLEIWCCVMWISFERARQCNGKLSSLVSCKILCRFSLCSKRGSHFH